MNLEANNNAQYRREAYEAQPFFAIPVSICAFSSLCLGIKGIILTAQATSLMALVAGLSITLFSEMLFETNMHILVDGLYNRSIEELRSARASPAQQITDALYRISTCGLKDKFFTTLREKTQIVCRRPFYSAACFSIICLTTYIAVKGLILNGLMLIVADATSSLAFSIFAKSGFLLTRGGSIVVCLGRIAQHNEWVAFINLDVVEKLGVSLIVIGSSFAAISSFPTAPLAMLAAKVNCVVGGVSLITLGICSLSYITQVCTGRDLPDLR